MPLGNKYDVTMTYIFLYEVNEDEWYIQCNHLACPSIQPVLAIRVIYASSYLETS